jgi:hypothetical protein
VKIRTSSSSGSSILPPGIGTCRAGKSPVLSQAFLQQNSYSLPRGGSSDRIRGLAAEFASRPNGPERGQGRRRPVRDHPARIAGGSKRRRWRRPSEPTRNASLRNLCSKTCLIALNPNTKGPDVKVGKWRCPGHAAAAGRRSRTVAPLALQTPARSAGAPDVGPAVPLGLRPSRGPRCQPSLDPTATILIDAVHVPPPDDLPPRPDQLSVDGREARSQLPGLIVSTQQDQHPMEYISRRIRANTNAVIQRFGDT